MLCVSRQFAWSTSYSDGPGLLVVLGFLRQVHWLDSIVILKTLDSPSWGIKPGRKDRHIFFFRFHCLSLYGQTLIPPIPIITTINSYTFLWIKNILISALQVGNMGQRLSDLLKVTTWTENLAEIQPKSPDSQIMLCAPDVLCHHSAISQLCRQ